MHCPLLSIHFRISILFLSLVLSPLIAAEKLIIGVEEINYLPYYHFEKNNQQGFAADLFSAFGREFNHEVTFRPLPIKRLYEELINQKIDFKFPDHPYWGQEFKQDSSITYSDPIVGFTDGVLVLPEHDQNSGLSNFGYVRGFSPWVLTDDIESGRLKVREINSLLSLLTLTLEGRIDGAFCNVSVADYLMKRELDRVDSLVLSSSFPIDRNNYRASTTRHPGIAEQLNRFLKSPIAKEIYDRYQLQIYPEN